MTLFFLMLAFQAAFSQKQYNIWYFGFNAGLDFNNDEPVPLLDGQVYTGEGSSSIADENGNLLFYTDGVTVYNKVHDIMQNGEGLLGHYSSSQSAFIVKSPGSLSKYYIFTVGSQNSAGLNYSIVDMSANSGLGAVTTEKNIALIDETTEGIAGTLHSNGEDIWIVARGFPGNTMYSYLITESGINDPVISSTGPEFVPFLNDTEFSSNHIFGCMKISPDGSKLAMASVGFGALLFDFDTTSGTISNALKIEPGAILYGPFGIEFSTSGNVLYLSGANGIKQFNLLADNIAESGQYVLNEGFGWTALQLAGNGKIYRADMMNMALTVINDPEIIGQGCNVVQGGVYLGDMRYASIGLPTAISAYFIKPDFELEGPCTGTSTSFSFIWNRQPDTYYWDFGDGHTSIEANPLHQYEETGTYTVSLTIIKSGVSYEVVKEITILNKPQFTINETFTVCNPVNAEMTVVPVNFDINAAKYTWQFNGEYIDADSPVLKASEFGLYTVNVSVNGCESMASVNIIEQQEFVTQIIQFCDDDLFKLKAIPVDFSSQDTNDLTFSWNGSAAFTSFHNEIIVNEPGTYNVTITTQEGCISSTSYLVLSANCLIQKGISPNNDGKNDFFDLRNFDVEYLSIFNRYGEEVYSMNNYTTQWYGQNSLGKELADGTYYYAIYRHSKPTSTGWVYINKEY